jgi:hypothetical protein
VLCGVIFELPKNTVFNIVKLRLIGWNAFVAFFISIRLN